MTTDRSPEYLKALLRELCALPAETEWVEFKENNEDPQQIGEYISAISNSAALCGKTNGYVVWGVNNETHKIVGTTFSPHTARKGNEELESWLLRLLTPRIHFYFYNIEIDDKPVVILEITRAARNPVQFQGIEYIRVGSTKKKLKAYPEKERALWRVFDEIPFERMIALERVADDEVLKLLDYPAYFELLNLSLPDNRQGILERLEADEMIMPCEAGGWNITNSPPKSRNEAVASFMRRIGVCEERGSGVDKVVFQTEYYQLPAPVFEVTAEHTRAILFAHKPLNNMDKNDKIRACYLHACLKYVNREYMTNSSLRDRFGIDPKNSAIASRIIKDTLAAAFVKPVEDDMSRKHRKYVPMWA